MKGKIAVFAVIIFTMIVLILCWFWLQDVITDYDLERTSPVDGVHPQTTEMLPSHIDCKQF
ncbi:MULTISPECIES: hypothetical protein [Virgibacillus]|uniref:Uncharacterized protein n=1 Tax=Virgibacillus dokdonensis TaxID=302167 RepID=A0A2K9IUL6_9BACI|nr:MULTISPECIES: hypothetical protein [Virgibacillus]AUJ23446.1 hypothetical protein A21D_00333 [Virgibacillus dokdonensis]NWO12035.1 hypothetical protein [Virgibacillus sp.]